MTTLDDIIKAYRQHLADVTAGIDRVEALSRMRKLGLTEGDAMRWPHTKGREMVEQMREKGDDDGADTWLRIIVAIGTLGPPPTGSRH